MFEGCILVFKNVLNAELLPLQPRLRARAVSERTGKGLLRPGHWGDPPPIRWQDVNPNPVHTKTCGEGGHTTEQNGLRLATSPGLRAPAAPRLRGRTRRASRRASRRPPASRHRPARRSGPYHVGRISTGADRKRDTRPTRHHCNGAPRPAPPPRPGSPPLSPAASALTAPARASWPSSCKRHLVPRLSAPENLAPRKPSNQRGSDAAGDDVPR